MSGTTPAFVGAQEVRTDMNTTTTRTIITLTTILLTTLACGGEDTTPVGDVSPLGAGGSGSNNNGSNSNSNDGTTCIEQACGAELNACTSACDALFECINRCGNDQACGDRCVDAAPRSALEQASAVAQCYNASCGSDSGGTQGGDTQGGATCLETQCGAEYSRCTNDAGCEGIFVCFDSCSDNACRDRCYARASASGRQAFDDLVSCYADRCG
jgi:hypothetical protein